MQHGLDLMCDEGVTHIPRQARRGHHPVGGQRHDRKTALAEFARQITREIGAGIISYVVIKLAVGKPREIHPLLYAVAALFVLYFLRGPLEAVLL